MVDTQSPSAVIRKRQSIDRLLKPRSIAIVGASATPGALGASVLANLQNHAFAGEIYLINPNRSEIGGRATLKSVDDLPDGVDVAILAIPRMFVVDAVAGLARRNVGGAVIFSAGFAEAGPEGLAQQNEIARLAAASGMVVEGPNCLGSINYIDGIPLTFIETPAGRRGPRPSIGIVSQSGAMAAVLATTLASRNLDLSFSVSTGNEAASGVEDYVEYLLDDPSTEILVMFVEHFRSPSRFLASAEKASGLGKRIILLHPGKSSAARESAATHTGAMAGVYGVIRAKVEQAGVIFAETLEELSDIAEIVRRCPALPSGGTAIVGESGAFKALTLDLCEALELPLPAINDADSPALRAVISDLVAVGNPLDLTAQGLVDPDLYYRTLRVLFEDDRFGAIIIGLIQTDATTTMIKLPPIIRALRECGTAKPVILAGLDEGFTMPADFLDTLRSLGVPYFPTNERAIRAVKRLHAFTTRDFARGEKTQLTADIGNDTGVIPEYRTKQILAPLGLPFPEGAFVRSLDDAREAASRLGFPVVLKAQSSVLSHKSDAGGVILNIKDVDGLVESWIRLHANIARHRPDLVLDGVLIECMSERGLELIVGARNDPDWGPIILAGFGGVTAEILADVRLLTPELSIAGIIRELGLLKSAALLHGFRGSPAVDIKAVAEVIAKLGRLLLTEPAIQEIDLNPVVIYPEGKGLVLLDALMLVSD